MHASRKQSLLVVQMIVDWQCTWAMSATRSNNDANRTATYCRRDGGSEDEKMDGIFVVGVGVRLGSQRVIVLLCLRCYFSFCESKTDPGRTQKNGELFCREEKTRIVLNRHTTSRNKIHTETKRHIEKRMTFFFSSSVVLFFLIS